MNEVLISLVLGFIQAIAEFLPISSSGHLILAKAFFNFDSSFFNLSFDIILHLGSLVALIIFFRKDLLKISGSFLVKSGDRRLGYSILLAIIPAIILGLLLDGSIEDKLRQVPVVLVMLFIVGILFIVAENISKKKKDISGISLKDAFIIGIAQSLALVPGVSRSGITITSGLFLGFKRDEAARFSFLLSIPTILLAFIKDIYELWKVNISSIFSMPYFVGFLISAVTSFLVIKFLINYLKNNTLKPFAYYRFTLVILFLVISYVF